MPLPIIELTHFAVWFQTLINIFFTILPFYSEIDNLIVDLDVDLKDLKWMKAKIRESCNFNCISHEKRLGRQLSNGEFEPKECKKINKKEKTLTKIDVIILYP